MSLHLLSNGRYAAVLSRHGGGYSALDGFALTRWSPDPVTDTQGFLLYIRDVESGEVWSIGGGTSASAAAAVTFDGRVAQFTAERDGIACVLDICIDASHDVEVRTLRLKNTGTASRSLEVTTYAELALNTPAGDAAHPAFSKLFVQTAYEPSRQALLAWRRQRSPEDRPLWAAHTLNHDAAPAAELSFETDRMRFIGRGRDGADPAAMCAPLSGTTGNVLDPVFSMRAGVRLAPGADVTFAALLAAAESREGVLRSIAEFAHVAAAAAAMERARDAHQDHVAALGLPAPWRDTMEVTTSAARYTLDAAPRGTRPGAQDAARDDSEPLEFFNGFGGFSAAGDEYVIRMPLEQGRLKRPPLPWVNVIANEEAGCIVGEGGAIYMWSGNSRENRLTPWSNDPVSDPHREAIYIRDDADGTMWSPMPGPRPGAGAYEVRHGFGRTRFLHDSGGIACDTTVFVPTDAPVRIVRVRLTNTGRTARRLSLVSYAQLVLGSHEAETRGHVETWQENGVLYARNPDRGEFSERVAFACAAAPAGVHSWTTDRAAFLGSGSTADPAALHVPALDGRAGAGLEPCFALACSVDLAAGESVAVAFALGEAADTGAARRTAARFTGIAGVDDTADRAVAALRERLDAVQVRTPSRALDLMVNGWLAYQNLSCRMWARSAYYQSGGAFGFRDQLQDSSALLYLDPSFTRAQILLHAAHQFVEGDVLHWWHPPRSKGIRTRFSDDLLWLPYITLFYLDSTGDAALLDEHVRFLRARLLEEGEDEAFLVPEESGTGASLYEHCCLALDRSLTRGPHGLPLMGAGDWNDGMNRVGREGRGESVWLGFFIFDILRGFIPICEQRGDHARVSAYTEYRAQLRHALNDTGWDGEWYRRAYYDNGEPLGSAHSDECRIDALAQAWAVMSGAAPAERAAAALDSMEKHLVSEEEGLIRLLAPAFDRTPNDPGYIKGYIPGVRENGGQYTHGVLWAVRALAEAGRSDRAARLLEMLTPVVRGSADNVTRYMVEPYVVAADVYGVEPHVGRGGWTWYTGSAGWMFRIALESILGFRLHEGREIRLQPCIPGDWNGFSVRYRAQDGTVFVIDVQPAAGAPEVELDGSAIEVVDGVIAIPLLRDGTEHHVRVRMNTQSSAAPLERITSA